MTASDDALERWHVLASELKSYRDELNQTWGDLDDVALANYIAGRPTDAERVNVDRAIAGKPAVQEMIDVVRGVLAPAWIPSMVTISSVEQAANRLAETLKIWRDDAGNVVTRGIERFLRTSQLAAPLGDIALGEGDDLALQEAAAQQAQDERVWEFPIEEFTIAIRAKPAVKLGKWFLSFEFIGKVKQDVISRSRFALTNMADPDLPLIEGGCSRHSGSFHELAAGTWELRFEIGDAVRIVPVQLGSPSDASQEGS